MKRAFLTLGFGVMLAACGGDKDAMEATQIEVKAMEEMPSMVAGSSLEGIAAGAWRGEKDKARDQYRHPVETLQFFGLTPDMTVVEIWPGGGWYTQIIAPFMATGSGTYYAAGFDPEGASERGLARIASFAEKYTNKPNMFGDVRVSAFSSKSGAIAPAGSTDMVLSFRNVHNWMGGDFSDKAFSDFYTALKPGGILGVVEHRARDDAEQDPKGSSGYVRQDYVIAMAEAAGFELVDSSEVNANPADTADHPFGVWTLLPSARTSNFGDDPDPAFDRAAYDVIGESDRMTIKFRKPIAADGALLE